ncbi:MAG: Lon protease [Mycoplasmataceae bacterium]|nr:MAG: Lon protease [Mycoplasmataceae bacterium]
MSKEIANKFPQYSDFWNEYRTHFYNDNKDLGLRAIHVVISRGVYYSYRYTNYVGKEGTFYGKLFSKINADSIKISQNHHFFKNIYQQLNIKDKSLFTIKVEARTDYSKSNEKTEISPQTTDYTNIPYTQGEDMISDTFGRNQLLKQQKKDLKTITHNKTMGRRIQDEDGNIQYKDTYDKTDTETIGEKTWLAKLLSALQYINYDLSEIIKSYAFLFRSYASPKGEFVILPSGKRKWIGGAEWEDEEEEAVLPKPKKKKITDFDDITWQQWIGICQLKNETPTQENYYLECITRYRARKEKEIAPVGSLTALAIDKQKELAEGLIKAWESKKIIPDLDKFDGVMDNVLSFNEFKRKFRKYLVNLKDDMEEGKPTEQTIYVLLGPPGIGKSYIVEKLSEATGWNLVDIDLGGRKDTEILEGTTPAVKGAFAGRLCEGLATGKQRNSILLLDEFDKVGSEALRMMLGNVLDSKKNKNWYDQFLGFRVDLSHTIIICTANYADEVPDFVRDRATFINIELYTYPQRVQYVMTALKSKLSKDNKTARYTEQLTEEFCKYIISETWGLRQTNANIEEIYKSLKYYAVMAEKRHEIAIENLTNPESIEITPDRFNLKYQAGQEINLNRVRTFSKKVNPTTNKEEILTVLTELKWPDFNFSYQPQLIFTR